MTSQGKSRGWCITWNNYSTADYEQLCNKCVEEKVRYAVVGKEKGVEGTVHLQAYMYFHNTTTFNALKKGLSKCHIESARCGPEYNRNYCMKGEQPHEEWVTMQTNGPNWGVNADAVEFGVFPEFADAKKRSEKASKQKAHDWEEYKRMAKEQKLDDIPASIYIRCKRSFDEIAKSNRPKKEWLSSRRNNAWIWGPTHTGKSWVARTQNEPVFVKEVNKWWDNFEDEDLVLIEDWDVDDHHTARRLKLWADIYPFRGETKGGHISEIRPRQVVVTSNYPMDMCFKVGDLEALQDRFEEIYRGINVSTGEETKEDDYREKLTSRQEKEKPGNPVPRYDPYAVPGDQDLYINAGYGR